MLMTLDYRMEPEISRIRIGNEYYFGELWDGDENGKEILKSGSVAVWDYDIKDYKIVEFKQLDVEEDILKTLVEVTGIF